MTKALMAGNIVDNQTLGSGDELNVFGAVNPTSVEANTVASCTEDATFSNLRARIISGGSGTNNFRFRDTGGDGNQLATRAGTGDCEDAVNTDTLTAGDTFNIAYTDTGTASGISWLACNVELASGYGAFHGSGSYPGTIHDAASSTRFLSLSGPIVADGAAAEANFGWKARGYTTFESIQVSISANARTNDSFVKNRINSGDGTGSITIGAGATGLLTDTGLADAIGDGQIICGALTLGTGVEDLTIRLFVGLLKSTDTQQDMWCCAAASTGLARAASATAHYLPISGYVNSLTAFSEANARMKPGYAGTASNLRCYLSANTYTSDATLKLYQNGSPVITLTLTAGGGAAWYENTSDTVSFDDNDEFSLEFDEGGTGSATIQMAGLTLAPTVAGGFVRSPRGLDAGMGMMRGGMQ